LGSGWEKKITRLERNLEHSKCGCSVLFLTLFMKTGGGQGVCYLT